MFYSLISNRSALLSYVLTLLTLVLSAWFSWDVNLDVNTLLLNNQLFHIVSQQFVILSIAFYVNWLLLKHKLMPLGDYSLLFMIAVSLCGLGYNIESMRVLLALSFSAMMIGKVKSLFNQQESIFIEFEVGLLAGLSFLAHPVFVFVLPLALIAVLLAKANDWRDYMAVLLGYSFLIFLKACYYVWTDQWTSIPRIIALVFQAKSFQNIGGIQVIGLLIYGFIALVAINYNRKISDKLNIKDRIYYKLWLSYYFFMLLPFLFLSNGLSITQLALTSLLPLLVLLQSYFHKKKKWYWNDGLVAFLVIFCVLVHVFPS